MALTAIMCLPSMMIVQHGAWHNAAIILILIGLFNISIKCNAGDQKQPAKPAKPTEPKPKRCENMWNKYLRMFRCMCASIIELMSATGYAHTHTHTHPHSHSNKHEQFIGRNVGFALQFGGCTRRMCNMSLR